MHLHACLLRPAAPAAPRLCPARPPGGHRLFQPQGGGGGAGARCGRHEHRAGAGSDQGAADLELSVVHAMDSSLPLSGLPGRPLGLAAWPPCNSRFRPASVQAHSRGWRRDRLRPFPELRFTYEEGEPAHSSRLAAIGSHPPAVLAAASAVCVHAAAAAPSWCGNGSEDACSTGVAEHAQHSTAQCGRSAPNCAPSHCLPVAGRGQPRRVLPALCMEPGGRTGRGALEPARHCALHALG